MSKMIKNFEDHSANEHTLSCLGADCDSVMALGFIVENSTCSLGLRRSRWPAARDRCPVENSVTAGLALIAQLAKQLPTCTSVGSCVGLSTNSRRAQ
jgi:hypothetical protein